MMYVRIITQSDVNFPHTSYQLKKSNQVPQYMGFIYSWPPLDCFIESEVCVKT